MTAIHKSGTGLLRSAMFGLLLLSGSAMAQPPSASPWTGEVYFAEPVSGRKVTHYSVELPLDRTQTQSFTIPDDCAAVVQMVETGSMHRGSILDRRIWLKAESDCRYHNFLHRHPLGEMEDHVSGYDFMNARLTDLPIDHRCAPGQADAPAGNCDPDAIDGFGLLHHFPLAEPHDAGRSESTDGECRLVNGLFHGRLYVDRHGIRCTTGPDAPSLRLIAVDYADVNGDRYLDAVLRFIPIGRGAIRAPLILPVTRKRADGPFQIPEPFPDPFDS